MSFRNTLKEHLTALPVREVRRIISKYNKELDIKPTSKLRKAEIIEMVHSKKPMDKMLLAKLTKEAETARKKLGMKPVAEKKEKKEKKDKSHRGKANYLYNHDDEETDQIDNESEASGGAEGGMSEGVNRLTDDALEKAAAANQKRDKEKYGVKIPGTGAMDDVRERIRKREEANKEVKEAAPFIAAGLGKAAGALTGKGIAKATAGQAAKGGPRKKAADYATRKGADMAQKKITDHLTDKEEVNEESDKKGKGSGTKDACYHKVKSRYSVWPSAYASGALVKCRQKGAKNWGNSSKKD